MTPLLQGIRVLEISSVVLGPFAGQILADLGAEVVKVEPLQGDIARDSHPRGGADGALFVNNNRNKRALAIDLKQEQGKATLARLIKSSDVLLHNMRSDAARRLGLAFEAAAAINPEIIHCAAIGFGQRGRYRDRPAFDDVIQAASGLAGLAAATGSAPSFVPTIMADKVAALHVVYGILAALVARARGRTGAIEIEAPMFETMAAFVLNEHLAAATFADDGATGYPRVLAADRKPFATADGWIAVLPYTEDQWRRFFREIDRSDVCEAPWFADPRLRQSHIEELYAIVSAALRNRTTAEWIVTLSACDVPCSEINTLDDLLEDQHLAEVGFFDVAPGFPAEIRRALPQPVRFAGITPCKDTPPPAIGADTRAVLRECGHSEAEIDALLAAGVIRTAGRVPELRAAAG